MFSGLNTPKLQTLGLTRKGRPFFMTYQTHFLRQYPKKNTKVLQLSYMWKQKSVKRLVRYAVTHIWSRTAIE